MSTADSDARAVALQRITSPVAARVARPCLWLLVGVGALGGVAGLVRGPAQSVGAAPPAAPAAPERVAAFAESFVAAFLVADEDTSKSLAPFVGIVDLSGVSSAGDVVDVAVTDAAAAGPGYWAVTVGALVRPSDESTVERRYYSVGVLTSETGIAATALPALVPSPVNALGRPSLLGPSMEPPMPGDAVADAVLQFASALLAGDGEVSRYSIPGAELSAVTPPPFQRVALELMSSAGAGSERLVRAQVRGTTHRGGRHLLQYELRLVLRDAQWEVAAISGAPTLAPSGARSRQRAFGGSWSTTAFDPLPPDTLHTNPKGDEGR